MSEIDRNETRGNESDCMCSLACISFEKEGGKAGGRERERKKNHVTATKGGRERGKRKSRGGRYEGKQRCDERAQR